LLFEFFIGEETIWTEFCLSSSTLLNVSFPLLYTPIHFEEMNAALWVG